MADFIFRNLLKPYRGIKNVCIQFDRICSKRQKIFSIAGIPVYLDYAFFLIALAPAILWGGVVFLSSVAAKHVGIPEVILFVLFFLLVKSRLKVNE